LNGRDSGGRRPQGQGGAASGLALRLHQEEFAQFAYGIAQAAANAFRERFLLRRIEIEPNLTDLAFLDMPRDEFDAIDTNTRAFLHILAEAGAHEGRDVEFAFLGAEGEA